MGDVDLVTVTNKLLFQVIMINSPNMTVTVSFVIETMTILWNIIHVKAVMVSS